MRTQQYIVEYRLRSHPLETHYETIEAHKEEVAVQAVLDTEGEEEVIDIRTHTVH